MILLAHIGLWWIFEQVYQAFTWDKVKARILPIHVISVPRPTQEPAAVPKPTPPAVEKQAISKPAAKPAERPKSSSEPGSTQPEASPPTEAKETAGSTPDSQADSRSDSTGDVINPGSGRPVAVKSAEAQASDSPNVAAADSDSQAANDAQQLGRFDRPVVPELSLPARLAYSIYQGDASAGGQIGLVKLEVTGAASNYQSRFAVEFNWATRLLADNRLWQSEGRLTPYGLEPVRVMDQRGRREPRVYQIDWNQRKATIGSTVIDLPQGLQDRVSSIWQLGLLARHHLEQNPAQTANQAVLKFSMPMMASSRVVRSEWAGRFETILIRGQSVRCLHLVRTDTREDDWRLEFWLDPDHQFHPARMLLSDTKGRRFELVREAI